MELRQLEYFMAVVKQQNYTRAANSLFVSQPTLSVAIQKLECELGLKLLERDNKGLSLTKEGIIFQKLAEKILKDIDELYSVMRDLNPAYKKQLRIAFPSTIGSWLWKELFEKFPESYMNIELQVQDLGTLDIVKLLKSTELDIGYGVIDLIEDMEIEYEEIRQGELKLILPLKHRLSALERIPLAELASERVIMYHKNTTFTEKLFLEELNKGALQPNLYYVREQSTVFDIVAQGCGIAPVLNDDVSAIRDNPNITSRAFDIPIKFHAGMLWNKNVFLSESVREFQDFIRSYKNI